MLRLCLAVGAALFLAACAAPPPPAPPPAPPVEAPAASLGIAVPPFAARDAEYADVGRQVAEVIAADLARGGRFPGKVTLPEPLPAVNLADPALWAAWKQAGAGAVVSGRIAPAPAAARADGDSYRIEVRLLDVEKQRARLNRAYTAPADGWRRVAHMIADEVQKTLAGADGAWDSRIAYMAETPAGGRRLAVMDQDGANHAYLTPVLKGLRGLGGTGAADEIVFSADGKEGPARFRMVLSTAEREYVPPAPASADIPSPDGTLAAFLRNDALWVRARHGDWEKVVAPQVASASVAWAPNGRKLAFVRATPAGPRLFAVDIDTGHQYPVPTPGNAVEVAWLRFP